MMPENMLKAWGRLLLMLLIFAVIGLIGFVLFMLHVVEEAV